MTSIWASGSPACPPSGTPTAWQSPAGTPTWRRALALSRALRAGLGAAQDGPDGVLAAAQHVLDRAAKDDPPLVPDYLALVEPDTFTPVKPGYTGDALLLVAGRVGATRLIDNTPLILDSAETSS